MSRNAGSGQSRDRRRRRAMARFGLVSVLVLSALAAGCSSIGTQEATHGHLFTPEQLQQVRPGMSKEQVKLALGTPTTVTTVGNDAFYYISNKTKAGPFLGTREVDRRVVAVYFDQYGSVQRVANYGLKDGKIFDFISRETPSYGKDQSIIKQLFRNLGRGIVYGG